MCNGLMFTCKIQTSNPISSCVECLQICLKIYCIHSEFNKSKKRYITVFPKAPTCPFCLCGSDVRDEILHSGPYRPKTQTSLYRPGPILTTALLCILARAICFNTSIGASFSTARSAVKLTTGSQIKGSAVIQVRKAAVQCVLIHFKIEGTSPPGCNPTEAFWTKKLSQSNLIH